jgi:hypothetical protein
MAPVKKPTAKAPARRAAPKRHGRPSAPARRIGPPKRGKPKQQPKVLGRVGNVFDPEHRGVPGSLLPIGQALVVNGLIRSDADISVNNAGMFLVSMVGGMPTVGAHITWNATSEATGTTLMTLPTIADTAAAGGPSSTKASKIGMVIKNATKVLDVGGRVYSLVLDQRIQLPAAPSTMVATQWQAVFNKLTAHPACRSYAATTAVKGIKMSAHVVDNARYDSFEANIGEAPDIDFFLEHFAQWTTSDFEKTRSMSTLLFMYARPTATQNYTISVRGQMLTRWPVETVLGQQQTDVPTKTPAQITEERKKGEREGTVV